MRKLLFHLLQSSWYLLGLFLVSLAVVLMVQAELGPRPWEVLHLGLTNYVPLTLGQVMMVVGVLVVGLSWVLGVKPYIASVTNLIFTGVFVDYIFAWGWFPTPEAMALRVLYMLAGLIVLSLATGIYLSANLGSGPRDSLMIALRRITGWRIGVVRTMMEVTVVVVGVLLGGIVGVATLIFSVSVGWFTEFFINIIHRIGRHPAFEKYVLSLQEPSPWGLKVKQLIK